jgi:hypothetical protein
MPLINIVNNPTRKQVRAHIIRSEIILNSIIQNELVPSGQKVCAPARETTVERENKGGESRGMELRGGEGKAKIRLREGRNGQPNKEAIAEASSAETCMGMKYDLWKFIARPVADVKSSSS